MLTRQRITWNQKKKASPPPQMPAVDRTEAPDHPAYYPDPEADKYENGNTSSWAEDPKNPMIPESAPPAMPGNLTTEPLDHPATSEFEKKPGKPVVAPPAKQASLREMAERRATLCVRIASAMMPTASVAEIENKAFQLMDLDEHQLMATANTLKLVAGEEVEDEEEEEEEEVTEASKKANLEVTARLEKLEASFSQLSQATGKLVKAMEHFFGEDKAAGEDMSDDELMAYIMAQDQDGDGIDQSENDFPQGYDVTKLSGEEGEEDEEAMLKAMLDEMDEKTAATTEQEVTDPLAKGPGIQSGEGGNTNPDAEVVTPQVAGPQTGGTATKNAGEEDEVEEEDSENDIDITAGVDPFGLMGTTGEGDSELMRLYADISKNAGEDDDLEVEMEEEVEAAKKAAAKTAKTEPKLRPQPKTASKGAKILGIGPEITRTAKSELAELEQLWESAPDVSGAFGGVSRSR